MPKPVYGGHSYDTRDSRGTRQRVVATPAQVRSRVGEDQERGVAVLGDSTRAVDALSLEGVHG
jgi:hypothetical protein